jgi:predicted RNA-binding protein with PUA-like domain
MFFVTIFVSFEEERRQLGRVLKDATLVPSQGFPRRTQREHREEPSATTHRGRGFVDQQRVQGMSTSVPVASISSARAWRSAVVLRQRDRFSIRPVIVSASRAMQKGKSAALTDVGVGGI